MEPVVLPRAVSPVTSPDRVKRSRPREDSGKGSAFGRYLRERKEHPAEDAGEAAVPPAAEGPAEPGGQPPEQLPHKRVDIRV
jgi:hypothetical protein